MKTLNYFLLSCIVIFSSCGMAYEKHIVSNYYLTAVDVIEDVALSYSTNESIFGVVIPACVYAVGADEDFIIAKQHPRKHWYPPNKNITNYYIIPLKNKIYKNPELNVIGPLTKIVFENKRNELGISKDLDFTVIIEELE